MSYIEIGSPAYRRVQVSMLLGSVVTFAVLYSPQPLINVFSEQYHVSASTASLTISISTVALAIGLLFVSMFSNAWGRKEIMSISLILTSVFAILSYFSWNFQILIVIRLLEGISIAGFPATAIAYLNEEISPRYIGSAVGVYVAGTSVGAFVGRVVIGALTDVVSWRFSFLILGIISLLFSLWFWRFLPESKNIQRVSISVTNLALNFKKVLNRKLMPLYLIGFLLMGSFVTLFNYIGYPLMQAPYNLSQTALGLIYVVNLFGTLSSVWFGKLTDHHNRAHLICSAAVFLFLGALLTLNGYLVFKILGLMLFAFGFCGGHTVTSGWVGVVAPQGKKAEAASLYLLFYYAGSSFIGWGGGFFWTYLGWSGLITLICTLVVLSAALSLSVMKTLQDVKCKLSA